MRRAYNSSPLLQTTQGKPSKVGGGGDEQQGRLVVAVSLALVVAAAVAAAVALFTRPGGFQRGGSRGLDAGSSGSSLDSLTLSAIAAAGLADGGSSSSDGSVSASLAAAYKRARKAAALPPAAYRSSAEGLQLSEGAAAAAAACRGERCDLVQRFVMAAGALPQLAEAGGFAVQHCPDALGTGMRPLPYTPHAYGNRCEPLYTRGALELVRQLVGPGMRGLEWFTGGSTTWFLARLDHLTSIEAATGFAAKARRVAEAQYDAAWLQQHWDLRILPPRRRVLSFADSECGEAFADYCAAAFVGPEGAGAFDVVSVQGFARMACLRRAVALLRPQGGLLVLPQAQRPAYAAAAVEAAVPSHWLRLRDAHAFGETLVWMSLNAAPGQAAG